MRAGLCRLQGGLFRIAAAGVLVLLGACGKPPVSPEPVRTVRVMQVRADAAPAVLTFPGEVRARHESRLAFRLGGKMIERRVEAGTRVHRGDVLARIDAQDAALNAAQAEAARALAQAEVRRYRDLREKNFVSQAVLDSKETVLKTATAQAGMARNQAAYATLVADGEGVITALEAETGQVVGAGQTIFRVAQGNEKEIAFAVPESELAALRDVESFAIRLNSLPGRSWNARLREVAPAADATTRTYAVRLSVMQADEAMQLGMSATVEAKVSRGGTAYRLPLSAFFTRDAQTHVWVVDPHAQTVAKATVHTDGMAGNDLRVIAGLQPGQWVVTAGANLLEAGQKVRLPEGVK